MLERPEMCLDANWSEIGDRYILKLFRDYVFHQVSSGIIADGIDPCLSASRSHWILLFIR